MTTTASRGNLRVTVRAASPLGAAASALLAMFRPCGELGVAHEVNARARNITYKYLYSRESSHVFLEY